MTKVIRQSAFETNSSSSHSFTLEPWSHGSYKYQTIKPNENGVITIRSGDFTGNTEATCPEGKASYLLTVFSNSKEDLPLLADMREVIMEHCKCTEVIYEFDSDSWLDNEGTHDTLIQWLTSGKNVRSRLKEWLFNPHLTMKGHYNG